MKKKYKSLMVVLAVIIVALFSVVLISGRFLYSVDKIFSDALYYKQTTTDTKIKIIGIDEKTLEALGPMNTWNRNVPAELLEILSANEEIKPSIIAFDIMYMGNVEAESDKRFAQAAKKAGNVVVASRVTWRDKGTFETVGGSVIDYNVDKAIVDNVEYPYEELRANVEHGFANTHQDEDGYIRFGQYKVDYNGEIEKSFAAKIYEIYCRENGIEEKIPKAYNAKDFKDMFYFTYSGKISDYEVIPLIDVLNGETKAAAFDDCIVLVGAYATGMMDAYNVPIQKGAQMYGVEIHANIVEALMEEKTAVPVSSMMYIIAITVIAVGFYLANRKLKPVYGALLMAGLIVVDVIVGKLLFGNGYVMDIIYLPVILMVVYVAQLVIRIITFNRMYTEALKEQMYSFADAFATAVDERTPYNGSHTKKVTEYVCAFANYSNMLYKKRQTDEYFDKNRIGQLRLAATLHDIGKMIIPKAVMNKATRLDKNIEKLDDRYKLLKVYYETEILSNRMSEEEGRAMQQYLDESIQFIHDIDGAGFLPQEKLDRIVEIGEHKYITPDGECIPFLTDYEKSCLLIQKGTLTNEEREIMESHVVMTSKILSKVKFHSFHKDVASIASNHHEFINGTGYPMKKGAEELSVECRVLTIADIYDALTCTDRPYKKPMPRAKAFSILEAMVEEGKLDGQLVKWFEEAIEYYYKETEDEKNK